MDEEEKNKKRFWHSETFWRYMLVLLLSVTISVLASLSFNWLVGGD